MVAQIAAARFGAEQLGELINRYGLTTFAAACDAVMNYAERLMRQAIAALPDGRYSATTYIDGYLDDPDPARRNLPLVVTINVEGDEMTVDLTGTTPQVSDRPINMPLEGTVDIAIWLTVRSVLLDTDTHGHIPVNDGLVRPIHIIAPQRLPGQSGVSSPNHRPLLSRQPTGRHRYEGTRRGRTAAGVGRHWEFAGYCVFGPTRLHTLGSYGDF